MNIRFLLALYMFAVAPLLSSEATQVRQEKSHRSHVLEALSKRQCLQIYSLSNATTNSTRSSDIGQSSSASVTRSVTRGATRSARGLEPTSRRAFIPEITEQIINFSNRFKELIKVEFGLPFGGGNNYSTYQFLIRDKHESKEKLFWMNKLGFEWNGHDEPTKSPDWITLAKNYKKTLIELGIDEKDFFIPVMVFYKDIIVIKNGVETPSKDYRFVDPLKEDINGLTAEWKLLTSDVQFNLPFSAMMDAMKKGMFPMLDAVHDIFHFVSFLRFPEATKAELAAIRATPSTDYSSGFKRREYWLTEALSILFPESRDGNLKFLEANRGNSAVKSVDEIRIELRKLKPNELIKYSKELALHFGSQLRDISGGNSSPAEKWFYLGDVVGVSGRHLVDEVLPKKQDLSIINLLSNTYFRNESVMYQGNIKPMTNETATFSFSTFNMAHRLLAQGLESGLKNHFGKDVTKEQLLQDLIEYTARTEFLIRSAPLTPARWFSDFLTKDMDPNGTLGTLLSTVFGNEIVTRFYLGEGEKRAAP